VAEASSGHGVVAMGAGDAPVMRIRETGRAELPSPLEVVQNSSVESLIMARSDGNPLQDAPTKIAPKSPPGGEA
jgi:hypothetical protein